MTLFKKYYIYLIELVVGNVFFNFVFAIVKTLTFHKLGATRESFNSNLINSFKETFILYIVLYAIAVLVQVLYDNFIISELNKKLNQAKKKGGNRDEE